MGRHARTAALLSLWCLAVLAVLAVPAAAATPEDATSGMIAAQAGGSFAELAPDRICEKARARSKERGPCAVELAAGATAPEAASAEQLAADADLVGADGIRLGDYTPAGTGTIWTRTWWQEARGLYYINWWEKHTGRIYWNSGHVWSTVGAHGYTGRHNCDQGGGIGYDIKVTACFTERLSENNINEWDYWKVYVFFQGFPISASYTMRASAWGSGNIYFYW
ncbi:MAG: hypothetical protein ACYC1P_14900 [Gaiellaceae bacterium]